MPFAQTLNRLMTEKGITAYKLAKEIHVHQTTISNWLSGKSHPSARKLPEIAAVFNVSASVFLSSGLDYEYDMLEDLASDVKDQLIEEALLDQDYELAEMLQNTGVQNIQMDLLISQIQNARRDRLVDLFNKLNSNGQIEAIHKLKILTESAKFKKQD